MPRERSCRKFGRVSSTDGTPGPDDPAVPSHGMLFDDPLDSPPVVPARVTPTDGGRLYRSAGAEGSLAEAAIPALTRAPAPDPSLPLSPEAVAADVSVAHAAEPIEPAVRAPAFAPESSSAGSEVAAAGGLAASAAVDEGVAAHDAPPEGANEPAEPVMPATAWPAASPLAAAAASLAPGSGPSTPVPPPGIAAEGVPVTPVVGETPLAPATSTAVEPVVAEPIVVPPVAEPIVVPPNVEPVAAAEPVVPLVPIVPVVSTLGPLSNSSTAQPAMQAPDEWFEPAASPDSVPEPRETTMMNDGGLTWTGAAIVTIGVTLAAALIETLLGQHRNGGVGWLTGIALLGSTVYCALRLRVPDIWAAVIMPPLAYLAALVLAGLLKVGASGSFISRQAINIVTGLALGAPWILGSTLVALVIVLFRRSRHRRANPAVVEREAEDLPAV